MKELKCNLVKDEFISSMYINIDEYLRLTNAANKAKQDLDTILDRLSYVSESKACAERGKLFAHGMIDGIKNNKLEELKEGE
jgi:hypothetical protein